MRVRFAGEPPLALAIAGGVVILFSVWLITRAPDAGGRGLASASAREQQPMTAG